MARKRAILFLVKRWAEEYFLPIVQPMFIAILPTPFRIYPIAADRLKRMVQISLSSLLEEINRYKLAEK